MTDIPDEDFALPDSYKGFEVTLMGDVYHRFINTDGPGPWFISKRFVVNEMGELGIWHAHHFPEGLHWSKEDNSEVQLHEALYEDWLPNSVHKDRMVEIRSTL